jgi:tetratricopeptide (TPR) repeat protein
MGEPSSGNEADFFVSRAGANKAVAREVTDVLRGAGYTVKYQDEDIPVGSNFVEAMHDLLKHSRHLIVLLSPAYAGSPYCKQEWTNFLASSARDGFSRRFIVLRVADCVPEGLFSAIVYADLVNVTDHEARKQIILAAAEGRLQDSPRTPPVFSGVPERNTNFAGRERLLSELRSALLHDGGKPTAITQAQAISGLGGVGKTSIAAEYAHAHKGVYAGVWWAAAERRETLVSSLAGLGARLDRKLADVSDTEAVAQQALGLIARSVMPWLLVYDNVESPQAIHGLVPTSGAHVLITTRWSDWFGEAREAPVDVFARDVAADYLQARAKRSDPQGALRLAEALGYLPLALDHAGAYCRRTGSSFDAYRGMLADLVAKAPKGTSYPESIFATFDLAIRKAIEATPEAGKLMEIVAYLAPERIPVDLVDRTVMSEIERSEAIAALVEVSLVTLDVLDDDGSAMNVHRLVSLVMRRSLEARGLAVDAATAAVTLLNRAWCRSFFEFSSHDLAAARRAAQWHAVLLPHALAAIEVARQAGHTGTERPLLLPLADFLCRQGELAAAERLIRRALAYEEPTIAKGRHCVDNVDNALTVTERNKIAGTLGSLARSLKDAHLFAEAEDLSLLACSIARQTYVSEPTWLVGFADYCACRGEALQALGRFKEAEQCMQEGYDVLHEEYHILAQSIGWHLLNFAKIMRAQGNLSKAERFLDSSLGFGRTKGNDSLVGNGLLAMTQVVTEQGRLADAERFGRQAISQCRATWGEWSFPFAQSLDALAALLVAGGRLDEALPILEQAGRILAATLGAKHIQSKPIMDRLGALYDRLGRTRPVWAETGP